MQTRIQSMLLGTVLAVLPPAQQTRTPRIEVDAVWLEAGELRLSVTAHDLLDEKARRTLEQGGTSTIGYTIELFKQRAGWFDALERTLQLDFRVRYDPFEKTYRLQSDDIRLKTEKYEEIVTQCARLGSVSMGLMSDLGLVAEGIYYITVRGEYQPVAAETLDELKNWLGDSGKNRAAPQQAQSPKREGLGARLGRVLMSAAGLGEQQLTGESARFRPSELPEK